VALIGIFAALPVVLYGQFESADRQMRDLVTRALQDRSALIADALAPTLKNIDPSKGQVALNADLAKYSRARCGGRRQAILFRGVGAANPR
jgi:two-component system sensor histidine kinase ChvG